MLAALVTGRPTARHAPNRNVPEWTQIFSQEDQKIRRSSRFGAAPVVHAMRFSKPVHILRIDARD
jgi:hypothetical protein